MKIFDKDLNEDVVVVAEIGVNHEGDLQYALRLLELAAESGADAVKFQTYSPERFVSASDPERLARVTKFALSAEAFEIIAKRAEELKIYAFSTPVTEDVVPLLDSLFSVFKIASGDLTFEPVIRAAAGTGKPVILSTGLGTFEEIETAIDWVRDELGFENVSENLAIMHCVTAYPTAVENANVRSVPWLAKKTGLHVGYSDHVIGLEACYSAIALGASIIEVHFTDNKYERDFHDHALSCDPDDLKQLVRASSRIKSSLGKFSKNPLEEELPNLATARKGIVAARDLEAGHLIEHDDLMFARPATEFSANDITKVIGLTLLEPIKKGELVRRNGVK